MLKKIFKYVTFLLVLITMLVGSCLQGLAEEQTPEGTDNQSMLSEEAEVAAAQEQEVYTRGKVTKLLEVVDSETQYSGGVLEQSSQKVEVLILEGPYKGKTYEAEYSLNQGFNANYKSNRLDLKDEVLLSIQLLETGEVDKVFVAEFARDKAMLYLFIVFVGLLVLIGGLKGFKSLISLSITVVAVVKILLPAILAGWDPVLVSVVLCVGIIIISMLILNGFNRKTISAVIGTAGGVIFAGVVALIFASMAKLTGLGDEETQMLMYIPQNVAFNFRGILFSGILISTMGATMDVGMSVASAMNEIKKLKPDIHNLELIKSGMTVGRDVIGTMTDTLILAYAGSSLPLMLLLMAYDTPFTHIINWDMMASEVLRALAGSIGIIVAVPLTALSVAGIEEYRKHQKKFSGVDYR